MKNDFTSWSIAVLHVRLQVESRIMPTNDSANIKETPPTPSLTSVFTHMEQIRYSGIIFNLLCNIKHTHATNNKMNIRLRFYILMGSY